MNAALVLARRNLEHVRQVPEKLIDVTLQPLMFVLLFAYVFGGVIAIPDGSYREYLVVGILVQTLAFGIMGPGVSIATDISEGMIDRLRTLPIRRGAYLAGHLLAELAATTVGVAVISLTGLIVGWRVHTGLGDALAGFAILGLFAFTMLWLGTLAGVCVRTPDAVAGLVFTVVFPLTFVANVFVPAGKLPAALRAVAEWNPVSAVVAAARDLFGNPTALPAHAAWPLQHPVIAALAWCAILLALAVPAALWRFGARTRD